MLFCVKCQFVYDTLYFTQREAAYRCALKLTYLWNIDTTSKTAKYISIDIYEEHQSQQKPLQHTGTKTVWQLQDYTKKNDLTVADVLKNPECVINNCIVDIDQFD
jgi:hypothetical protein